MKPLSTFNIRPHGSLSLIVSALLIISFISGCQTPPPPPEEPHKGLSPQQIEALVEVGFNQTEQGWELSLGERILFGRDVDALDDAGKTKISRITQTLKEIGITHLIVEGHTDNTGSKQYNNKLSERRARTIAAAISENGIPYENITQHSFGSARPVADNTTAEGRMHNRRVAIIIPVE